MLTTFAPNTDGRAADAHLRPSGRRNLWLAGGLARLASAFYESSTFAANRSSIFIMRGVRPC
jgi:hypothetical protein